MSHRKPAELISAEDYTALLAELKELAASLEPAPECVIGMKRSGLFPAVYLSHQLELPMLAESEIKSLGHGKFQVALLADTTAWKGGSLRKAALKLERAGVEVIHTVVMFSRREPPPDAPGLRYLRRADAVPRFWYE
jgi:orotate phosphoribosyltransferase